MNGIENTSYLRRPTKALNISLWILQFLLAALFLMAGAMKLGMPIAELSQKLPWTGQISPAVVRLAGLADLLGGLGLILPALTRIKPVLTTVAAFALALVMVLATIFHLSRGEASLIGLNIVLLGLLLFIGWGRIKPRS